jgi:serine/threonine protein kinase
MAPDPLANLYIGQTLNGRYDVKDFIAPGGFCLVFEGWDRQKRVEVALKILKPGTTGDGVIEFETESRLLTLLKRANNVVDLLGNATERDTIQVRPAGSNALVPLPVSYMVLELADSCLTDLLANRHSLSWEERLLILRHIVRGTHQMHMGGVVHRDLKSENVLMMAGKGKNFTAKVSDLGRSRAVKEPARFLANAYLAGRGDLRFAPPELLWLLGADDATAFRRADLYLIGSVFFELATSQGITSLAFGNVSTVLKMAAAMDPTQREREYRARLAETRARYEVPFSLFANEVGPVLRDEALRLLRQLCDPDPYKRELRFRADRADGVWGLQWLLRRVDIMRLLIRRAASASARTSRKKAV